MRWRTAAAALAVAALAAAAPTLDVGRFSAGDLQHWQTQSFAGATRYRIAEQDGRTALRADSRAAASGLYREIEVDLRRTPLLRWSWRVDNVLQDVDERRKSGDDFAARVYLVAADGAMFWNTRTLTYVWSNHQPVGSVWTSPYSDRVRQIAVRSGRDQLGRWLDEKRNVRDDFERAFGARIERIDAVAVMTDTDNSAQTATAWYGDIGFSAE